MAKFEEEPEEQDEGAPAWMVTFADLVTLLLTFFVLLLSFANTDTQKFKDMLGSIKDAFGTIKEEVGEFEEGAAEIIENRPNILDMKERERLLFFQEMKKLIEKNNMGGTTELLMEEDGVRLRIKGKALFKTGSAELNPTIYSVLDEIKSMLDKYGDFNLVVEGHTDNIPIKSERFPSNWELSASRAISVIRYYMEKHDVSSKKLTAVGYAATRPLVNNSTVENRATNRRVEFKFEQPLLKKYKKRIAKQPKMISIDPFERKKQKQQVIKQFQKELIERSKDMR